MRGLVISTTQTGDAMILTLVGSASMLQLDQLTRETDRCAAARPRRLILDVSQLEFLASLAIGQIVAMSKAVKLHGGTVVLAGANAEVSSVLRRCNIPAIIPMAASVEAALSV